MDRVLICIGWDQTQERLGIDPSGMNQHALHTSDLQSHGRSCARGLIYIQAKYRCNGGSILQQPKNKVLALIRHNCIFANDVPVEVGNKTFGLPWNREKVNAVVQAESDSVAKRSTLHVGDKSLGRLSVAQLA